MVKVRKGKLNLDITRKQKLTPSRIESIITYYEWQKENEKLDTEMLPSHGRTIDYKELYDNDIDTGWSYD